MAQLFETIALCARTMVLLCQSSSLFALEQCFYYVEDIARGGGATSHSVMLWRIVCPAPLLGLIL